MAARFSELVVDCRAPKTLAAFWCAALGYRVLGERDNLIGIGPTDLPTDDDWAEWRAGHRAGPSPPIIVFVVVPEDKSVKNRLHIDLSPVDVGEEEEVARLLSLGATRADIGQGDAGWTVMRDPEGNEFCVLHSLAE